MVIIILLYGDYTVAIINHYYMEITYFIGKPMWKTYMGVSKNRVFPPNHPF